MSPKATERLHLRWAWMMLLVFATLGIGLEVLHAFKIGWYLDVGNDARRLMLRLGHAHGTLLAGVNLGLALTVTRLPEQPDARRALASRALRMGSVLMPGGFVAGGIFIHGGDPGLGVLLVPVGAVALLVAITVMVMATRATAD